MNETQIKKAEEILDQGGIIVFPTDTAYGIGCRIDRNDAIKRLFKIRRRPEEKAVPVLVDSIEMAKRYLKDPDGKTLDLMEKYWPGALTIVYFCDLEKVPSIVRGGGNTLGVRMPDNDMTLGLIQKANVPVLGPSANFSGERTPYRYQDLDPELLKLTDFILKDDENKFDEPSTVIDCSLEPWKILRRGALKIKNI